MALRFLSRSKNPDLSPERTARLSRFLKKLKVSPKHLDLYHLAFVHSSFAHESGATEDNQRLEYLGDSVLSLIINDHLFRTYPGMQEGRMARIKAQIASEAALSSFARGLGLTDVVLLGRGEKQTGGHSRPSIQADALEAFIGALYLDRGWNAVYRFTTDLIQSEVESLARASDVRDPKTRLQERLQRQGRPLPEYRLINQKGPAHRSVFEVAVIAGGREIGRGQGSSRKKAEHQAALAALKAREDA